MKGSDLKKFFTEKKINAAALAEALKEKRQFWTYWYKQEKIPVELLERIAPETDVTVEYLRNYPPKPKKKSGIVSEDDTPYGKADFKEKYYNCIEEKDKVKSRLIEVLEENRTLRMKLQP